MLINSWRDITKARDSIKFQYFQEFSTGIFVWLQRLCNAATKFKCPISVGLDSKEQL